MRRAFFLTQRRTFFTLKTSFLASAGANAVRIGGAAATATAAYVAANYTREDARHFWQKTRSYSKHSSDEKFNSLEELSTFLAALPKVPQNERLHAVNTALQPIIALVGMDEIKKRLMKQVVASLMGAHKKDDDSPTPDLLNVIIRAPPGSGKTTLAQHLAALYIAMGLVPTDKLLSLRRSDLISDHVGGSTTATEKILSDGKGAVIFLDEAHGLRDELGGYGSEVMTMLVQFMSKNTDTLFIFAGYPDAMRKLEELDEGFSRRITFRFDIPDYHANDLARIFAKMCADRDFKIACDESHVQSFFEKNRKHFPQNGGDVQRFVVKCVQSNSVNSTHANAKSQPRQICEHDLEAGMIDYMQDKNQTYVTKGKTGWFS
jgi:SpoVK/Ycf46/Vps4 family AAA+-type ATPase